jgi:hypothetical protein
VRFATAARISSLIALLAGPAESAAQVPGRDPLARLEPRTRNRVELLIDSARIYGLPPQPLVSKALEGMSKRADDRKILAEVTREFRFLRDAQVALGPQVSTSELTAAAGALRLGITQAELAQLARSRTDKILTVPLVVLSDLISRGVPRDTASATIYQLFQRGAADDDFLGLWRGVERDIVSGTDPGQALLNRAREVPARSPGATPASTPRPDVSETQDR